MLSFHQAVVDDIQTVNALILKQLHSEVPMVENVGHYIVDAGGKRLRPLLVLLVAKSLHYVGTQHIDMAVIVEFIHTATLLHDDVVDVSSLRRGRATANSLFGNAPSVLVGDFLYSRAFQMLVTLADMNIMGVMANATNIIAEGEVLQLVHAGDINTSEAHYRRVIRCKTAQLFSAAAECGARLCKEPEEICQKFSRYGLHLGTAFQLIDDVLDYSGDSEQLGKNIGDDLAEGKPTLPLIYTLLHGNEDEVAIVKHAILEKTAENLEQIIALVTKNGALLYTEKAAKAEAESALACLDGLPDSIYRDQLAALAHFALHRQC